MLGSEAWSDKTKEMYYSLQSLKMISFILFPQASQQKTNFNISELVYSSSFKIYCFFYIYIYHITSILKAYMLGFGQVRKGS